MIPSNANLSLSSFEAIDKCGEIMLGDEMALIATMETPDSIKAAVLMLWFGGKELQDLSVSQSADAILLNTILHLLQETTSMRRANGVVTMDTVMRHVNIPMKYMPVFWKMGKDANGTPTPEELNHQFQLEE